MRLNNSNLLDLAGATSCLLLLYNSAQGNLAANIPIYALGASSYAFRNGRHHKVIEIAELMLFSSIISIPGSALAFTIQAIGPDHPATQIGALLVGIIISVKTGRLTIENALGSNLVSYGTIRA